MVVLRVEFLRTFRSTDVGCWFVENVRCRGVFTKMTFPEKMIHRQSRKARYACIGPWAKCLSDVISSTGIFFSWMRWCAIYNFDNEEQIHGKS